MRDITSINIVLDRSGSMSSIKEPTIKAINKFLEEQKIDPRETVISLVQFDDEYTPVYLNLPAHSVPYLNEATFVPRGWTRLMDAIGRTIDDLGKNLSNTPASERPSRVLVVIMTDGHENDSKVFSRDQIKEKIRHQEEKYAWTFVYLGANQDAFTEASSIGISAGNTRNYAPTARGMALAGSTITCSANIYKGSPIGASATNFFGNDDQTVLGQSTEDVKDLINDLKKVANDPNQIQTTGTTK